MYAAKAKLHLPVLQSSVY